MPRAVRRLLLASVAGALAVAAAACGGGSGDDGADEPATAPPEVSTFRRADPAWRPTTHRLGRGHVRSELASFTPEGLVLRLDAGRPDGAEVQYARTLGDGVFRARMRAAGTPGSISAVFLYAYDAATDTQDEIDLEVPGGEPHRVITTVYRTGRREPVVTRAVPLSFDPAAAEHRYEIERRDGRVRLRVDGREVLALDDGPRAPLRPILNAWYPTWLDPGAGPVGGATRVTRAEIVRDRP